MSNTVSRTDIVGQLKDRLEVTVAAGTTCGSLGDERNLREFLVADEAVKALRRAGHVTHFLLFNDNLDALEHAQLRIAVEKNQSLVEKFEPYCGKPICAVPDPFGCHHSLSAHFEEKLLQRLHRLDCHPTLVNASDTYAHGAYAPYIRQVMQGSGEIVAFCAESFAGYQLEKLFYVLCPICGYIDQTTIEMIGHDFARCSCGRCGHSYDLKFEDLRGKLNYKLDCAVRWKLFRIDAETFGKEYMEPRSGSYYVSLGLGRRFFNSPSVLPLQYGKVRINRDISYKLLDSLPPRILRNMLIERPHADIAITRDRVVLAASRTEIEPGVAYLDAVKQLVPAWILNPSALNRERREILSAALNFANHILNKPVQVELPTSADFDGEDLGVLRGTQRVLRHTILLRRTCESWEEFRNPAKEMIMGLGLQKHSTLHRLRAILHQTQGLPASRFLYHLPVNYLQLVEYILTLRIASDGELAPKASALVLIPEPSEESGKGRRALLSD